MRLFLCSYFFETGHLLKEHVQNKKVLFIPTAAKNESYRDYVDEAKTLWQAMNTHLIEIDIESASAVEIQSALNQVDVLYFTGGNTFFLMRQLQDKGMTSAIHQFLNQGGIYVGESAGAMIAATKLDYAQIMDDYLDDSPSEHWKGLALTNIFVVLHYLCAPFVESSQAIMNQYAHLNLYPLRNNEALWIEHERIHKLHV